nr:MAG TPA: hypothetical protein [Caudoviricetes sp.]
MCGPGTSPWSPPPCPHVRSPPAYISTWSTPARPDPQS